MKFAAQTDLSGLSQRDILKIARRFNAGTGLEMIASPAGTAERARPFQPSLRDSIHLVTQPAVETAGYYRSSPGDKKAAQN